MPHNATAGSFIVRPHNFAPIIAATALCRRVVATYGLCHGPGFNKNHTRGGGGSDERGTGRIFRAVAKNSVICYSFPKTRSESHMSIFSTCDLEGVVLCAPKVMRDSRGFFKEISRADACAANGMGAGGFVQVNMSHSVRGVLRGLHYQMKHAQAKLVSVAHGSIYDVIVDCRKSSRTFGRWIGVELSAEGGEELFVPLGFAHGFYVRSETAAVVYQCSDYYQPGDEYGVNFASPSLGIGWGFGGAQPVVSEKDAVLPAFENIGPENLPE